MIQPVSFLEEVKDSSGVFILDNSLNSVVKYD